MKLTVGAKIQRDPIPEKTYAARCIGIFDLGKQYSGQYKKWTPKVMFMFEIPQVRSEFKLDDGTEINRPRLASRMYGKTWSDRGFLKPLLTGWRGSSYEIGDEVVFKEYLNKPAAVQIVHGKGSDGSQVYSNIAAITELMEGVEAPAQETDPMFFSFEDYQTFEEVETALDGLPEWIGWVVDKIKGSQEYENIMGKSLEQEVETPKDDADVPF